MVKRVCVFFNPSKPFQEVINKKGGTSGNNVSCLVETGVRCMQRKSQSKRHHVAGRRKERKTPLILNALGAFLRDVQQRNERHRCGGVGA